MENPEEIEQKNPVAKYYLSLIFFPAQRANQTLLSPILLIYLDMNLILNHTV